MRSVTSRLPASCGVSSSDCISWATIAGWLSCVSRPSRRVRIPGGRSVARESSTRASRITVATVRNSDLLSRLGNSVSMIPRISLRTVASVWISSRSRSPVSAARRASRAYSSCTSRVSWLISASSRKYRVASKSSRSTIPFGRAGASSRTCSRRASTVVASPSPSARVDPLIPSPSLRKSMKWYLIPTNSCSHSSVIRSSPASEGRNRARFTVSSRRTSSSCSAPF